MFIDTHCHLNLEQFSHDYKESAKKASDAGVGSIINVGASLKSSVRAIEIAKELGQGYYATVGIQPTNAPTEIFDEEKFLKLVKDKKVVAIGEIGLDYFGGNVDKALQLELMNKQINLANRVLKPVVFHCREAYDDMISALMSLSQIPAGVVHCYVGDLAHADTFLDMGLYLSFTGIITFTKSRDLENVVKEIPLNKILIETDAPWLAPEPHRGERNEPAFVVEVARKIAEIRKISLDEVARVTTQNAIDLFKLEL